MAKRSLLDRLATVPGVNVFVTPDEDIEKETAVSEPINGSETQQSPLKVARVSPPAPTFVSSMVDSKVDPTLKAKIQAIANNSDQVSYKKFIELLTSMLPVFPGDESAAYKATIAAAKSSGYSLSEVLRGLDVILNDLDTTTSKFKSAVPAKIADKVGERKQRISSIRQQASGRQNRISEIQTQITSIQAEAQKQIAHLQTEAQKIQAELAKFAQAEQTENASIAEDERSVNQDEENFEAAMAAVRSAYASERQKIQNYGGGK